jgi:HlyD family secretion protein
MTRISGAGTVLIVAAVLASACTSADDGLVVRATGYVDATEVRLSSRVPGRVEEVFVIEGQSIEQGAPVARLSPAEIDLVLERVRAERRAAAAQVQLLRRGARDEDIRQAEAQVAAARAEVTAAEAEQAAARADEARFAQLVERRAGAEKPRDDARARRELADARLQAAAERVQAAAAALARLEAGARAEEIDAAVARMAAADAQIASLEHDRSDLSIVAPTGGIVSARLVEPGELIGVGAPVATIVDLARAWVNAYVEEPLVPSLRIGSDVIVVTDSADRLTGAVAFVAPRAEFTPRNVQTADERARLVYRVRVNVDNREGILKPGMPVTVEWANGR